MKTLFEGKIFTIPNLLSFLRLCMIPWLVVTYVRDGNTMGTALILLLSGLTDIVDGFIARRFNMVSNLGKALDPAADKLTQIVMVFCLMYRFPHLIWILIALCVKELFVAITSLMAIKKTKEVLSAEWHGKAATVLIYLNMICHILFADMPPALSDSLIILCAGMIVLSGVLYGIRNVRNIRNGKS